MSDQKKQVIPVPEKRTYAYQSESSYPGASIRSWPSRRDQSEEAKRYSEYELVIHKSTDTSMAVTLRKKRADIVEQRKEKGAATTVEIYQTTLDFAELCNLIFAGGYEVYTEEEHFPESIKAAMRTVYKE